MHTTEGVRIMFVRFVDIIVKKGALKESGFRTAESGICR